MSDNVETIDLKSMTKAELVQLAADKGIVVDPEAKKDVIFMAVNEALYPDAGPGETVAAAAPLPDDGERIVKGHRVMVQHAGDVAVCKPMSYLGPDFVVKTEAELEQNVPVAGPDFLAKTE